MLLQRRNVRERDFGGHPVEARESNVPGRILNDIAVQIRQRTTRADLRRNIKVAKKSAEAGVSAWLVGEKVGPAGWGDASFLRRAVRITQ